MASLFIVMLPLGVIGPWQWVIIALVIVLLFGGKKIPELMHGLGKGVKAEIVKDDDEKKPEKKEEKKEA